jgi:hypothetical protein
LFNQMAGTGGKRRGAGRKPGSVGGNTKLAEALRAEFIVEYKKRKKSIWKALFDRAEQGDVPAIKEANERAMGKVVQEITGEGGQPIQVAWLSQSTTNQDAGQKPSTIRVNAG